MLAEVIERVLGEAEVTETREGVDEVEVTSREARERGMTMDELRAEKTVSAPTPYMPGAYERRLAEFVKARMDEADFADSWHKLPYDIPINLQPWWKTAIWLPYLAGKAAGMG